MTHAYSEQLKLSFIIVEVNEFILCALSVELHSEVFSTETRSKITVSSCYMNGKMPEQQTENLFQETDVTAGRIRRCQPYCAGGRR